MRQASIRNFWHLCAAALAVFALAIVSTAASAALETTAPSPIFTGPYESKPIRVGSPSTQAGTSETDLSSTTLIRRSNNIIDPQRLILALALVLGIIFALYWVGRRFFPAATGARNAGTVRVLSRTPVAHKQQVVLLQIGRRVLVVADNGTQMNRLSEISDADEVAHLVGQINSSQRSGLFDSAFGKAQESFDDITSNTRSDNTTVDEDEPAESQEPAENESIASTQGDINGLMDKVRGLAKQLGRSS